MQGEETLASFRFVTIHAFNRQTWSSPLAR